MAARCGALSRGLGSGVFASIFPSSARRDEQLQGRSGLLFPRLVAGFEDAVSHRDR